MLLSEVFCNAHLVYFPKMANCDKRPHKVMDCPQLSIMIIYNSTLSIVLNGFMTVRRQSDVVNTKESVLFVINLIK